MRAIYPFAVLLMCWSSGIQAQPTSDCGDVANAQVELAYVRPFFFDGGRYDNIRAGRWEKLSSQVTPNGAVTDSRTCRDVVRAVNRRITETYPKGDVLRTEPLAHRIFEIGPYIAVQIGLKDAEGFGALWIFSRSGTTFIASAVM
jgi:hypothetical protein